MVWGGIMIKNRTDLAFIRDGALMARRRIEEVLDDQIHHRVEAEGENSF